MCPMPVKSTKAQLQERIKELEGIIEKQDLEWNDLVKQYDELKAGGGKSNDEELKQLQEKYDEVEALMKAKSTELEEQQRVVKNYKKHIDKLEDRLEQAKQKPAGNEELENINTTLIIEKKELIEQLEQKTNEIKQLKLNNSTEVIQTDSNLVLKTLPSDMEESINKLVSKLTRNGVAVHTDVGNRTFLTMNDAKEYANLKHDDSIRQMLKGKAKSAGYVIIDGERVVIKDWRKATEEEEKARRQQVIDAIIAKTRD